MRRVRGNGEIKWQGELVFLSRVLVGEPVGLEPVDDGHWRVHYGPVTLGLLRPDGRLETRQSRWRPACGFVDSAEEALPATPQAQPPQQEG